MPNLKVIILGEACVGKTSLFIRRKQNIFTDCTSLTICGDFFEQKWNDHSIEIWDTAGCERFDSIQTQYCRGAGAAILAFDINNGKSFDDLSRRFEPMLKELALPDCLRVVVATRCDVVGKNPPISPSTAKNLAEGLNTHLDLDRIKTAPYFETSSKTGQGINELFHFIFQFCLVDHPPLRNPKPDQGNIKISADTKKKPEPKASSGGCC